MTQIFAYRGFWKKQPPVDLLVAWYLGYKPRMEMSRITPIAAPADLPDIEE